ncbi:TetR/AcrR family transcriptional regulator [Pseudoroseomonas wenyumeiae]
MHGQNRALLGRALHRRRHRPCGRGGPGAATLQAIARRVGAPTGSIYHRFASRSAILAAAWNDSYGSLTRLLAPLLRAGRPREAALALLPWSGEDRQRARFLLLHEPVSLFEDTPLRSRCGRRWSGWRRRWTRHSAPASPRPSAAAPSGRKTSRAPSS